LEKYDCHVSQFGIHPGLSLLANPWGSLQAQRDDMELRSTFMYGLEVPTAYRIPTCFTQTSSSLVPCPTDQMHLWVGVLPVSGFVDVAITITIV
jgi:hypothetical protein